MISNEDINMSEIINNQTFEAMFEELTKTLEKLEEGDLPLDESLALYEHGVELVKQ